MRFLRFALLSCMLISAIPVWADGGGVSGTFAPFRLVTSDLPPFANENQRDKPGFAVEITQAIAAKLGQQVKAEYYPWARAYALSQAEPRVVIIPLTRTPDRQAHFQWLRWAINSSLHWMRHAQSIASVSCADRRLLNLPCANIFHRNTCMKKPASKLA